MKEISRFSTRMLGTALSCLLLVAFALAGEQSPQEILQIEKDPGQNPWTHLEFKNDPNNFHFVIISDLTGRLRANIFPDAIRTASMARIFRIAGKPPC